MKLNFGKNQSRYSHEVSRFLNYLSARNSQYNSEEFDTPNIFRMALSDYHIYFWGRVASFLITIVLAFIGFFFLNNYNQNLAQLFFYLVIAINIIGFFLLPKFKPDGVCYSKIINKVKGLDKSIINSGKIDFELIEKILRAKHQEEEVELYKLLYNRIPKMELEDNKQKLNNLERLIVFYYFSKINISTKRKDEELIYLVASLLRIGKGTLKSTLITELLKLNNIGDEKFKYEYFDDLRPLLGTTLNVLDEIKNHIKSEINKIENLKNI